jgi:glutathione S-transferase
MQKPRLIIGNKNYSSWSFRAWLMLAKLGIDFEEVSVALFSDGFKERLLHYSPAGQVPVYLDGELVIWDSLAIAEYLAEHSPQLWPSDIKRRTYARSVVAEMHSGFFALRETMPMNCRATDRRVQQTDALAADIQRIQAMWTECRRRNSEEGPWLFGVFSIADAMYAPVVSRFHTYGVVCDASAAEYMKSVLDDIDVKRWYEAARHEAEVIEHAEVGLA